MWNLAPEPYFQLIKSSAGILQVRRRKYKHLRGWPGWADNLSTCQRGVREHRSRRTNGVPVFESYGFTPPSAGVIARGPLREDRDIDRSALRVVHPRAPGTAICAASVLIGEVKICKDSGLTINQSKVINGENYIVVNYRANSQVVRVWILWEAQDRFFSPRLKNSTLEP